MNKITKLLYLNVQISKYKYFIYLRCGYSQDMFPIWEKLAQLKNNRPNTPVKIGKIDCDNDEQFCEEQGIGSYPTMRFYNNGVVTKYVGERELQDLLFYIKRNLE